MGGKGFCSFLTTVGHLLQVGLVKIGLGDLKNIICCTWDCFWRLKDPVLLLATSTAFFSIWALHCYQDLRTSVCKREVNFLNEPTAIKLVNTSELQPHSTWIFCGDEYPSRKCPTGYVCTQNLEKDEELFTFDGFVQSYISIHTIAMLDYWEPIILMVFESKYGKINIIFFALVIIVSCTVVGSFLSVIFTAIGRIWSSGTDTKETKQELPTETDLGTNENQNVFRHNQVTNAQVSILNHAESAEAIEIILPISLQSPKTCWSLFLDFFCGWNCCKCCDAVRRFCACVILDPFAGIVIASGIILNIYMQATDQLHIPDHVANNFGVVNLVFTFIFILEALLKIVALGPKGYFKVGWNCYDFLTTILCCLQNVIEYSYYFSLMKYFRLARYWPIFNNIIKIQSKLVKIQINFAVILVPFALIMAAIGCRTLGENYVLDEHYNTSWHMRELLNSFIVVFRALCGEWIESLWDCQRVNGWSCFPFFMVIVIIGNLVLVKMLTICMVIVLGKTYDNIDKEKTSPEEYDTIKAIGEGVERLEWMWAKLKTLASCSTSVSNYEITENLGSMDVETDEDSANFVDGCSSYVSYENPISILSGSTLKKVKSDNPGAFCPNFCQKCFSFQCGLCTPLTQLREKCSFLVQSRWFEYVAATLIVGFSICLILDDNSIIKNSPLDVILFNFRLAFKILFVVEMFLRLMALGIGQFARSGWRCLEVAVILLSFLDAAVSGLFAQNFLRSILVLRFFRILTLAWPFDSTRSVANTLIVAFPGLINVLAMGSFIWTFYSIVMVQLFAGLFLTCLDENGNKNYSNHWECQYNYNFTLLKPEMHFDNVIDGFLALTQLATMKGWIDIANNVMAVSDYGSFGFNNYVVKDTPESFFAIAFFIFFISYGLYVLWFSVLVDAQNRQRKEEEARMNLTTPGDVLYYKTLPLITSRNPQPRKEISQKWFNALAHEVIHHEIFDYAIVLIIILNFVNLAFVSHWMSQMKSDVLLAFDMVFLFLLIIEVGIRTVGLGRKFPVDWLNILDIVIILIAIIALAQPKRLSRLIIPPPMLLRVFRLARIISSRSRITQPFTGLKTLISCLKQAIPKIVSIVVFLFCLIVVYAVVGMHLFKHIKKNEVFTPVFNFETFGNAFGVMTQISVSSGWDSVLSPLSNEFDCEPSNDDLVGNCGNRLVAVVFCLSFVVFSYLILYTMITVVLLETYAQVKDEINLGLSFNALADGFYRIWHQYDPVASGYIHINELQSFLEMQDGDFRVMGPNRFKVAAMDIPIVRGEKVHHRDVLDALIRRTLLRKGFPVVNPRKFQDLRRTEENYEPISTTLWRKREEAMAKVIQRAWGKHRRLSHQ